MYIDVINILECMLACQHVSMSAWACKKRHVFHQDTAADQKDEIAKHD